MLGDCRKTFQAVRQRQGLVGAVNHRAILLGECGDCLSNPSLCSIFRKSVREMLKAVIHSVE